MDAEVNWQTYNDPDGYFSFRFPREWEIDRRTVWRKDMRTSQQPGKPSSAATQGSERSGPRLFGIDVSASPPHIDYLVASHIRCMPELPQKYDWLRARATNCTLGEIPAFRDRAKWVVETPHAHFELSYALPGEGGGLSMPFEYIDKPVSPEEELAPLRALLIQVIETFQPGPSSSAPVSEATPEF